MTDLSNRTLTIAEFLDARLIEDEAEAGLEKYEAWWVTGGSPFDPDRVRAECAAKRLIIGWHSDNPHECEGPQGNEYVASDDSKPCSTMLALTSVYSDHPDYRQEWAL